MVYLYRVHGSFDSRCLQAVRRISVSRRHVIVCPTVIRRLTRIKAARCVKRHTSYSVSVSRYHMTHVDKLWCVNSATHFTASRQCFVIFLRSSIQIYQYKLIKNESSHPTFYRLNYFTTLLRKQVGLLKTVIINSQLA